MSNPTCHTDGEDRAATHRPGMELSCNSCWTPGLPGRHGIHWLQTFPTTCVHSPQTQIISTFPYVLRIEAPATCPAAPVQTPLPKHISCWGRHGASALGWQLQRSVFKSYPENHPSKINPLYSLLCRWGSGERPEESGRSSPPCVLLTAWWGTELEEF